MVGVVVVSLIPAGRFIRCVVLSRCRGGFQSYRCQCLLLGVVSMGDGFCDCSGGGGRRNRNRNSSSRSRFNSAASAVVVQPLFVFP